MWLKKHRCTISSPSSNTGGFSYGDCFCQSNKKENGIKNQQKTSKRTSNSNRNKQVRKAQKSQCQTLKNQRESYREKLCEKLGILRLFNRYILKSRWRPDKASWTTFSPYHEILINQNWNFNGRVLFYWF